MARNNPKTKAPPTPPEPDDATVEYRRGDTGEQPVFADLARGGHWQTGDVPAVVEPAAPKRARTGLVTSVTFVLLLVAVAAGGNQGVSDKLADRVSRMGAGYLPASAALTYGWRFSARGAHDIGHAWLAQLVSVAAFVVLATLLVAPVVRGVVTWFRAFFGVLGAVVVATALAQMVGEAIRTGPAATPRGITRAERILFFSSDGPTVLASLVVGVGAALIIASVAVATRRSPAVRVAPPVAAPNQEPAPESPPPYYGEPEQDWRSAHSETGRLHTEEPPADPSAGDRWVPSSGPWNAPQDSPTEGLVGGAAPEPVRQAEPVRHAEADEAHTAQLPPTVDDPEPADPGPAPAEPGSAHAETVQAHDATQQFPRLPDDEHSPEVADEELPHREDRPGTSS